MNLTTNSYNGVNLLIAEGAVEETGLKEIAEALERLPLAAGKLVLLECADSRRLVLSGIGFSGFVSRLLQLRAKRTRIVLIGCDQQTLKLLRLLKLEHAFEYAPTLDEAYLTLRKACLPLLAALTAKPKGTSYA